MDEKQNIYSFTLLELKDYLVEEGFPQYRASQMFRWIYGKSSFDIAKMTDISSDERDALQKMLLTEPLLPIESVESGLDGTVKYAFSVSREIFESVLMPGSDRTTVCLSSQTGCALGCRFCATGRSAGRNMSVSEIVGQYARMQSGTKKRVTNVVFMGMGEPMLNLENVLKSILILNDPAGAAIGARRITVSTAGITEGIDALRLFPLQVKLAVSLNSAVQRKREMLMPVAKRYTLDLLASSLKKYQSTKKRKITFEYILLNGINDSDADADALKKFAGMFDCKINLIPYNGTSEEFKEPSGAVIESFKKKLSFMKDSVSVRFSRGRDIAGACGQLKGMIEKRKT